MPRLTSSSPRAPRFRVPAPTSGRAALLIACLIFATAPHLDPAPRAKTTRTTRVRPAASLIPAAPVSATPATPVSAPAAPLETEAPVETGEAPVGARPQLVPDPRIGDLRADDRADVLPVTYSPPAPAQTRLDLAYGHDEDQRLDLFLPAETGAPTILYLHAGGWVAGDKAEVPDLIMRFVERGHAVASVGYRLAPDHPFPAPVDDARLALDWLKARGAAGGAIDPDRIVVAGASAGGHLATMLALEGGVAGLVNLVGPTDLVALHMHGPELGSALTSTFLDCAPCTERDLAAASPSALLHGDLPPAYWAFGAHDSLVTPEHQGLPIATEWAAMIGTEGSWYDLVDDMGHNLDESTINQRELERFVDRATGVDVAGPAAPSAEREM